MAVAKKFWNITQDKRPKVAVDLYNSVKSYYGCSNINDCKKAVFDAAKASGYLDGVEGNSSRNKKWGTVDAFWQRPGLRKNGLEALGRARDAEMEQRTNLKLDTTKGIYQGDIKNAVEKYLAEVKDKDEDTDKGSVWDSMAKATGLDANLIKWVVIGAAVLLGVAILVKVRRKK